MCRSLLRTVDVGTHEAVQQACHPSLNADNDTYLQPSHRPVSGSFGSNDMLWDDWWPLDDSSLDQGTVDRLANDADNELQSILDFIFEASEPIYD